MRRHSFEVCKFVKMLTILTGNKGILEHASALEIFLFQISLHSFSVDVRLSKSEHNPDLKSWTWMARAAARRRRRGKERRPILFLASPWLELWLLLGWSSGFSLGGVLASPWVEANRQLGPSPPSPLLSPSSPLLPTLVINSSNCTQHLHGQWAHVPDRVTQYRTKIF